MTEKAAWTVMVYLAGDNNLTDASVYAMTEMKKVTPGAGVNVITQFDPSDDYLPTHRYHIGKNDAPGTIGSLPDDIIDTYDKGRFKDESAFAQAHERLLRAARKRGRDAALEEAKKLAPGERNKVVKELARVGAVQRAEPENAELEPMFLEPEERPLLTHETDTGSPITLYNFLSLCVQKFPADHYMVILCGHGSGTATDFLLKDDSPVGSLTISEMKAVFQQLSAEIGGRKIDILGMDTCLMSMAEVAYELRDVVKTMVSSESYSPVSGWPYQQIMENLNRMVKESLVNAEMEKGIERRIATSIVEEFVNFYADYWLGGLSVDQAALDVEQAETLRVLVDSFADGLSAELEKKDPEFNDDLILAHWEAQSYNGELFVDLVDFCDCLLKRRQTGLVYERGSKLRRFILEHFVIKSCYSGPCYQYSHGASIYFPWSRVDHEYQNLEFVGRSRDSGWGYFLEVYTNETRRELRRDLTGANAAFFTLNRAVAPLRFRQTQGKGPGSGNRIYSMRNPPVFADPPECIRSGNRLQRGLMTLLKIQA